jgi:hypothetical protein
MLLAAVEDPKAEPKALPVEAGVQLKAPPLGVAEGVVNRPPLNGVAVSTFVTPAPTPAPNPSERLDLRELPPAETEICEPKRPAPEGTCKLLLKRGALDSACLPTTYPLLPAGTTVCCGFIGLVSTLSGAEDNIVAGVVVEAVEKGEEPVCELTEVFVGWSCAGSALIAWVWFGWTSPSFALAAAL